MIKKKINTKKSEKKNKKFLNNFKLKYKIYKRIKKLLIFNVLQLKKKMKLLLNKLTVQNKKFN